MGRIFVAEEPSCNLGTKLRLAWGAGHTDRKQCFPLLEMAARANLASLGKEGGAWESKGFRVHKHPAQGNVAADLLLALAPGIQPRETRIPVPRSIR